jgi:hypothetical protein
MSTTIALNRFSPVGPGPIGYPEAAYGYHLFDQPFCETCHAHPFPLPASVLLRFPDAYRVTARYSISDARPRSLPRDFIYDLWLEQHPVPGAAPRPGDIEALIFLYHAGNIATCLQEVRPAALTTAAVVNGGRVATRWRICQTHGGTQATPIAFFLASPSQSQAAEISLPLGDFVAAAARYARRDVRGYSLMGIELGGEFDQCSSASSCAARSATWRWRISRLALAGASGAIPIVFPSGR